MTSVPFTCRVCDHNGLARSFSAREMMYGIGEVFSYVQCEGCKTLQIEQIPQDLGPYYQSSYYSFTPVKEDGFVRRIINRALGIRERGYIENSWYKGLIEAFIPPVEHTKLVLDALAYAKVSATSKILDVGCGNGTVLHRLKEGGYKNISGIDPYISQDILYKNGLRIAKKNISELEEKFDLITFHHSFEHVVDPVKTLQDAKQCLTPGGKILLRVPTVSSEAWDLYNTDWFQLDAPRHLYLFSRDSIRLLAAKSDLKFVGTYDDSSAGQFLASEQYRQGIALNAENSYLTSPKKSIFTSEQIETFRLKAQAVNKAGRGDQIVVVLSTY